MEDKVVYKMERGEKTITGEEYGNKVFFQTDSVLCLYANGKNLRKKKIYDIKKGEGISIERKRKVPLGHMSQDFSSKKKGGSLKIFPFDLSLERNRSQDLPLKGDGFGDLRTKKVGNNYLCKCESEQTKKREGLLGTSPSEVGNCELRGKQVCMVVHFLPLRYKVKGLRRWV